MINLEDKTMNDFNDKNLETTENDFKNMNAYLNDPLFVLGSIDEEVDKIRALLRSIDRTSLILNTDKQLFNTFSEDLIREELSTLFSLISLLDTPVDNLKDIVSFNVSELKKTLKMD